MDHETQSLAQISTQFSKQIQICLLYIHSVFMRQALNDRAESEMEATTLY